MMYLEVRDFDPGPAMEYLATSYPGPGVFRNPRTGFTFFVGTSPGSTVLTVMLVYASGQVKTMPESQPSAGITENFVLRAIAIAKDPGLAQALLSGA